ncbi:MAG: phospholipid-binding protein MlaC [Dissulfurispiraceae bacterium]
MKNMKLLYVFIVFVIFLAASSANLYAGEPTNQVKGSVDKVIDVLKDKELKKPSKAEQRRAAIREVVGERFDFEEMSKRTLALNWQKRTAEERTEFVSLFSDLLERSYINKIESYTDEKIIYGDESVDADYATVKSKIITKRNVDVPIEYKLIKKGAQWKVYDVVIEGVSLVNNYRNQFNMIIRTKSYQELVNRLKNKQEQALFEDKSK